MEKIEDWEKYTSENLESPFDAVICDDQEKGPLKLGDKLSVKSVNICGNTPLFQIKDQKKGLFTGLAVCFQG